MDTNEITHLRTYQRDNSELTLKVHAMLQEMEELRAAKEQIKLDYEQRERVNQRRIIEESAMSKALHVEKESLKAQVILTLFIQF